MFAANTTRSRASTAPLWIVAIAAAAGCASPAGTGGFPVGGTGIVDSGAGLDGGTGDTSGSSGGQADAGTSDGGATAADSAPPGDVPGVSQDVAQVTCTDPCEPEGGRRCVPNKAGHQNCHDPDGDGCFQWSKVIACSVGEVCHEGSCAPQCPGQDCTAKGARKCDGDGVMICEADGDGCLSWTKAPACPNGQTCANGHCALSCKDECTTKGAKKCDGAAALTCDDSDANGCLDWGKKAPCGSGEVCSGGTCAATCKDECTTKGGTKCEPGGVTTCGDYN